MAREISMTWAWLLYKLPGDFYTMFEGQVDASAYEGITAKGQSEGHGQPVEFVRICLFTGQGVTPTLYTGKDRLR